VHLTHQRPDRIPALIAALARTAPEPAAFDTGRGPKILTDEQLKKGLAEAEAGLAADGDHKESFIEFLNFEREIRARHRDQLATVAYRPPEWITVNVGERPADHERRALWDAVVDRALLYRTEHGIRDDAPGLLGPPPTSSDVIRRIAWNAARRSIQSDLRLLTMAREHGRGAISR
jgi:hypothetical protein